MSLNTGDIASLNLNFSRSDRGNPGVPVSDADLSSTSTPFDRQSDQGTSISLSFSPKISDAFTPKLTVSDNLTEEKVHYANWDGTFSDGRYVSRITQAELSTEIKNGRYGLVTAGLEFKRNYGESTGAGIHTVDNGAFYVNTEAGHSLPVTAGIGLRADTNSAFGGTLTSKIGFLAHLDRSTVMRTSVGTAFRAPTINELYWNDPYTVGNANLKPENSITSTISLEKQVWGMDTNINYYLTRISDMIQWLPTDPSNPFSIYMPVNLAHTRIEGFEVGAKGNIFDGFFLSGDVINETAVNEGTSRVLTYSPRSRANVSLLYENEKLLSAKASIHFVSDVSTGLTQPVNLAAYQTVDVSFFRKIRSFEAYLNINNIFNETYFESAGYSSVDGRNRGYPMPGRRIMVGIKI
ncbi:MAG: TonB-dependent receptor [Candidatus Margulisiibacteriota bacterium]